jgi:hypothetical protein
LHDQYLVSPAGGSGTKQQRMQRAVARLQLFKSAPNVDQDELVKEVVSADDARLTNKLLIPSGQKQASQAYAQDLELVVMVQGRPVPVNPGDDHATHIMEIVGFLHKQQITGAPVDPMAKNVIGQHLAAHFQYLKQQQPQVAKQLIQAVQQLEQSSAQPGANGNGNGAPATGANGAPPANGNGAPSGNGSGGPQKESISINYKDAPDDIKRQMEAVAGFEPSRMPTPQPVLQPPPRPPGLQ